MYFTWSSQIFSKALRYDIGALQLREPEFSSIYLWILVKMFMNFLSCFVEHEILVSSSSEQFDVLQCGLDWTKREDNVTSYWKNNFL